MFFCYTVSMSTWSTRRKANYFLGAFAIVLLVAAGIATYFLTRKPNCFDGRKNGDEIGVDCGGSCVLLCRAEYVAPTVLWSRQQEVVKGTYNVLAYIENPNPSARVDTIGYVFKLYDKNDVVVAEARGTTFIPPVRTLALFVSGVKTGEREPNRVTFEFQGATVWTRSESADVGLVTTEKQVVPAEQGARIEAYLRNTTLKMIRNIETVVVAYDEHDNAIAFSRTVVDSLDKGATARLVYTWPKPFSAPVTRIEIIPRILQN